MSLLKRIETIRSGANATEVETRPAESVAPIEAPFTSRTSPVAQPLSPGAQRLISQVPVRESFRDVKFRVQGRVISDLDPKLDLANQAAVRRQIEEIFTKVVDE